MDETDRTPTESRGSAPAAPTPEPFPDFAAIEAELAAIASPPELLAAERREEEAMVRNHPGEFVAYRDTWDPPVFRREIVARGPSYKAVFDAIDHLRGREREQVCVTYCDTPEDRRGFRVGYRVGRLGIVGQAEAE